jgi:uncharacterized protein (TIGR00730 family)
MKGEWGRAPGPVEVRRFLEGPQPRRSELWRALGIFTEFIRGFRALHFVGPCVTVFGSARFKEDHWYYAIAREIGRGLAGLGFTVVTGGGPGIMEAANRGAREARGRSIGCIIELPVGADAQRLSRSLDHVSSLLRAQGHAGEVLVRVHRAAGGFGTLDEIFETATLIQTGKIQDFPIVLVGRDFWRPLTDFLHGPLERMGLIDPRDADRIIVADSAAEAVGAVRDIAIPGFGLRYRVPRRRWLLNE